MSEKIVWPYHNLEVAEKVGWKDDIVEYVRYFWPSSKIENIQSWEAIPVWWSMFNN